MNVNAHLLAQTKLYPPLPRDDLVPRPRLCEALRKGISTHALTLVSAPAGYGKTTLLAQALSGPSISFPLETAWLTLDERDNDPALFLAYLIAALRRLRPEYGNAAQSLLNNLSNPAGQTRRVINVLLNEILTHFPATFTLVLDDLHLITESSVYQTLDYLLERMPPQMHLLVSARYVPPLSLSRHRAQGELAELRLDDLRFTLYETTVFLKHLLPHPLSSDEVERLHHRTEGWPAGLRLFAATISRIPIASHRAHFVDNLPYSARYISEFLADEVLDRQGEPLRSFLLETSILDELTAPLCQSLTGQEDAGLILTELERRNLLTSVHASSTDAYRYHSLFARFLRRRLKQEMPERLVELHRLAAQAQEDPTRAIAHYLAAKLWEQAALTIEQVGEQFLRRGLLDTLVSWIEALPEQILTTRPRLLYFLGACAWRKDNWDDSCRYLNRALQSFEPNEKSVGRGETLADLANCSMFQGDFQNTATLIQEALACHIPDSVRAQLLMERVWLAILRGDHSQASTDFQEALLIAQESDDPEVWRVLLIHFSPLLTALSDGLTEIERLCRRASAHLEEKISLLQVAIEGQMTFIHLWRGRLEQALQSGKKALSLGKQLGDSSFWDADVAVILGSIHAAQGNYRVADRYFEMMLHLLEKISLNDFFITTYLYPLGRARWMQGRLDEAHQVYARMTAVASSADPLFIPALRTNMRGLLEIAEHRYSEAEETLRRATQMERDAPLIAIFGSAAPLLAYLYWKQGRHRMALNELLPQLADCEKNATPGRLLQHGAPLIPLLQLVIKYDTPHTLFAVRLLRLLGYTDKPHPLPVPATGEILSSREVEVLRLLTAGNSNRAIAKELFISPETVKSHVSHILRKLNVSSRTRAAIRAKELGITSPLP